ncbi:MAG: hypothetical protein HY678_10860 [Chloroflexi bacterium]|nr:hypothetical protein [Chloroflexota bacterium]
MGPDLYSGTSGVALFLCELYRVTRQARFGRVAACAIEHALSHAGLVREPHWPSFYSGAIGISYAATRLGMVIGRQDLLLRSRDLLDGLSDHLDRDHLLDVVNGTAGGAVGLLVLSKWLRCPDLILTAERFGRELMAAAEASDRGWSWSGKALGFDVPRNLTGLGHGAAGFGWSLLELYRVSGDPEFRAAAQEAFRYETSWFREDEDNWPDFRYLVDGGSRNDKPPCSLAWCHGGVGIGLSRFQAMKVMQSLAYQRDVNAAIRACKKSLSQIAPHEQPDIGLCHGLGGVGELILQTKDAVTDLGAYELLERTLLELARRFGSAPDAWPCGIPGESNPSLMLGQAGIGYLYLRAADPATPSILLPISS